MGTEQGEPLLLNRQSDLAQAAEEDALFLKLDKQEAHNLLCACAAAEQSSNGATNWKLLRETIEEQITAHNQGKR